MSDEKPRNLPEDDAPLPWNKTGRYTLSWINRWLMDGARTIGDMIKDLSDAAEDLRELQAAGGVWLVDDGLVNDDQATLTTDDPKVAEEFGFEEEEWDEDGVELDDEAAAEFRKLADRLARQRIKRGRAAEVARQRRRQKEAEQEAAGRRDGRAWALGDATPAKDVEDVARRWHEEWQIGCSMPLLHDGLPASVRDRSREYRRGFRAAVYEAHHRATGDAEAAAE